NALKPRPEGDPRHPLYAPAGEPIVKRRAWTITLRHISPGRTGPETPQIAVDLPAVVDTFNSTAIGRQERCDDSPFFVAQFVTAHGNLLSRRLNHTPPIR